mmetsp:Transcript_30230/g.78075  ORF Transcript_30230/g.78075 Transcript_30230/m.78075 type:complete len:433 (-) Transcript_30230:439-1737(-)
MAQLEGHPLEPACEHVLPVGPKDLRGQRVLPPANLPSAPNVQLVQELGYEPQGHGCCHLIQVHNLDLFSDRLPHGIDCPPQVCDRGLPGHGPHPFLHLRQAAPALRLPADCGLQRVAQLPQGWPGCRVGVHGRPQSRVAKLDPPIQRRVPLRHWPFQPHSLTHQVQGLLVVPPSHHSPLLGPDHGGTVDTHVGLVPWGATQHRAGEGGGAVDVRHFTGGWCWGGLLRVFVPEPPPENLRSAERDGIANALGRLGEVPHSPCTVGRSKQFWNLSQHGHTLLIHKRSGQRKLRAACDLARAPIQQQHPDGGGRRLLDPDSLRAKGKVGDASVVARLHGGHQRVDNAESSARWHRWVVRHDIGQRRSGQSIDDLQGDARRIGSEETLPWNGPPRLRVSQGLNQVGSTGEAFVAMLRSWPHGSQLEVARYSLICSS